MWSALDKSWGILQSGIVALDNFFELCEPHTLLLRGLCHLSYVLWLTRLAVLCCCPDRLVDEGFNPAYGARPLRRAIMRLIEDCLAERILGGDIKEGDVVIMDVDPDGAIAVLAGDKKMRQVMDATPAGIS